MMYLYNDELLNSKIDFLRQQKTYQQYKIFCRHSFTKNNGNQFILMRLHYLLSLLFWFWFLRDLYVIEINAHAGFGSVNSTGSVAELMTKIKVKFVIIIITKP